MLPSNRIEIMSYNLHWTFSHVNDRNNGNGIVSYFNRKKIVSVITASHFLLFTVICSENQIFGCLATTQNSQIMGINLKIGNKDISVFNNSMDVPIKRLMIFDSFFFSK